MNIAPCHSGELRHANHNDAVGVAVGKRPEQPAVYEAEDGVVGPIPKASVIIATAVEPGRLTRVRGKSQVLDECLHHSLRKSEI